MSEMTLQEGYRKGRKRGWAKCEGCGIMFSFNDPDLVRNHIENNECESDKKFMKEKFGIDMDKINNAR